MKKSIIHYIQTAFLLLLLLGAVGAKAQGFVTWSVATNNSTATGTFTGGTVDVSQSGTNTSILIYPLSSAPTAIIGATGAQCLFTQGALLSTSGNSKKLVFTFSKPVIINEFTITDIDYSTGGWADNVQFNGLTFTSVTSNGCSATTTAAYGGADLGNNVEYARWLTSTTPITSFSIDYPPSGVIGAAFLSYAMKVTQVCNAGTTAPTFSSTTVSNACPATTAALPTPTSTTPTGATLKWFKDSAHTIAVADATAVIAGTYYAFYYDATNNCYSPASAAVTATIATCPALNITNTCPAQTVDLSTYFQGTVPSGYALTFHTGTPATTANKVDKIVSTAGTYYGAYFLAAQDCYSTTGRPLQVTIANCCAATIAPNLTN